MAAPGWLDQVAAIAERGRHIMSRQSGSRRPRDLVHACETLLSQRGEATSLALASDIVERLRAGDGMATERFLELLASRFGPDPETVRRAADAWTAAPTPENLAYLTQAVEPARQELFRRLNMVPHGTQALVDLRAALLRQLPERPEFAVVDADLKHLFSSWFNRGFLQLQQITWETPADVLERLIAYEAVHAIAGWQDLHLRLAADRRCFAFFHPALPREPLIFVEVALARGISTAIAPLIDPGRKPGSAESTDTAIFYSISSGQEGLRGVSFGSFLIKQVMGELSADLPTIKRFATLSPLPKFAAALRTPHPDGLTPDRVERLLGPRAHKSLRRYLEGEADRLADLDAELSLLGLAYLMRLRLGHRVFDPVGHFHLSNGARIERVNPRADGTASGRASDGLMVNYLYDPAALEANHEAYVESGRVQVTPALSGVVARINSAWESR